MGNGTTVICTLCELKKKYEIITKVNNALFLFSEKYLIYMYNIYIYIYIAKQKKTKDKMGEKNVKRENVQRNDRNY
jgi:hypothetical protein